MTKVERDMMKRIHTLEEENTLVKEMLERERERHQIELASIQVQLDQAHEKEKVETTEEDFSQEKKNGIHLIVGLESRIQLFQTKRLELHDALWKELLSSLHVTPNHKITCPLLLDLVFFIFTTGISLEALQPSFKVNGETFSATTLMNWFDMALDQLQEWAEKMIYFLDDEEWRADQQKMCENLAYEEYHEKLFYFVDGSVVESLDSSDPVSSRNIRNGKHCIPAFMFFVLVTSRGRIVYFSEKIAKGSVHDKTHFNRHNLNEKLQAFYPTPIAVIDDIGYQREIVGDKAYPYIEKPPGWFVRVTKTAEETKDVDEKGKEFGEKASNSKLPNVIFDKGIARLRSVVERTIGKIKQWPVFHCPQWCSNITRVGKMLKFAAALVNWMILFDNIEQI